MMMHCYTESTALVIPSLRVFIAVLFFFCSVIEMLARLGGEMGGELTSMVNGLELKRT